MGEVCPNCDLMSWCVGGVCPNHDRWSLEERQRFLGVQNLANP